jgi:electron transport complex protein RnfC
VPTKYPSGGEKQLIKLLTDVEVPSGHIPADVGIVCQNIGTAYATARAVHQGEPLVSRIVTVTGEAVAQPQNFDALIGTPYELLLQAARVRLNDLYRLVVGGPMMGFTVDNDQIPVIKTTNCLIAASPDEMPEAPPAQECIRCGLCEQVCPAELLPQQLYWFAKGRELDKARHHNLFDCIECGACSYVCSSFIPLVQHYRNAKAEIRSDEAEQRKAEHARQRFEARQARLEAEQAEKEARRKARAEEAARNQAARKDMAEIRTTAAPAGSPTQAQPAADAATDLKQLKTAASVARTKLKQAQKALKNTEDKGLEGADALRVTVSELNARADAAQQAYDAAEAGDAGPAVDSARLAELKADMAAAQAKVDKAQAALDGAIASGSPAVDKMTAGVEKLNGKYQAARSAWQAAGGADTDTATENSDSAIAMPDIKDLKQQVSIMRTKLKKAEKRLQDAAEDDKPGQQQEVADLQARLESAKAELAAAEQVRIDAAAAAGFDLKQLQVDAAMARAEVTRTERALSKAEPDTATAALEQALQQARTRAGELNQTLSRFE